MVDAQHRSPPHVTGLLLELAACDDLPAFRRAVEEDGLPINGASRWYGRWWSGAKGHVMGYMERTPLMVGALYGSTSVVDYILSTGLVDINQTCGSDSATALHCAAAGGSASSVSVVTQLVNAFADIHKVDAGGKKPVDVIAKHHASRKVRASLETVLRGGSLPAAEVEEKEAAEEPKAARKEYPVDATLPDIKSGVYGTDEFRMYSFKVRPCSRAYTHDWTECPFVHPGENARRRDPRKFQYSCVPCPDFRKGSCRNGDACEYAHGVFESWLHPQQYRTRLCKDEVGCNRRVCFFAHKPDEIRQPSGGCSPVSMSTSPSSSPVNLPPLDLGAAAAILLSQQQQLQQPMSPSSTPSTLAAMAWLNQNSRLKSDLELELLSDDYSALLSPLKPPKHQHSQQQQQQQLLTSALLNSRASAFAKRSQSFIDRGAAARSSMVAATVHSTANYVNHNSRPMHNWSSPDGKLDWAIRGEELSKLRKSASFGFRSNGSQMGGNGGSVLAPASIAEEPDVSWVQSLVADVKPRNPYAQFGGANKLSSWGDQLYLEQEQIFA